LTPFLLVVSFALYALYGTSMGLHYGMIPALVSGAKMPALYLISLAVCLPPFYVLNCSVGPKLPFGFCLRVLLLAVSANALALASYAPVSYFFTLTGTKEDYYFLVAMHVGVLALAGLASVMEITLIFRAAATAGGISFRPTLLVLWGLLYAFVGTQLSWALRPWIGSPHVEYVWLRPREGTFFEAIADLLAAVTGT
jgi:hypothetical protein